MTTFAAVRMLAAHTRPYFAMALFAMEKVDAPIGTLAVDKYGRIYYDAKVAAAWGVKRTAYVLIHEVEHWLREHFARAEPMLAAAACQECERQLVNVAEDMEINDDPELLRELPEEAVTPQKFGLKPGALWEEYYQTLKKQQKQQQASAGGGAGHAHAVQRCGSAAHGQSEAYELPAPGGTGKNKTPGLQGTEADLLRRAVAREVRDAASREPGKVPAGLARWAERILRPPQVPWERELGALIRRARTMAMGAVDYTYAKISRRGSFSGVLMPALRRPTPDVALVLDTSGSMSEADLEAALSEITGIVRATGQVHVPLICCDAAAAPVQRVRTGVSVQLVGGGGTDMGVGIAAAEKLGVGVIVVLTDGYTPWPPEPPGAELVVALVRRKDEQPLTHWGGPPYARRVVCVTPRQREAA